MNNNYIAEASAIVEGRAETAYAILSDYRNGHPNILPKPYFTYLTVIRGGQGAGTVMDVGMQVFGAKRSYHLVVSEPQPGRVLLERDEAADVETTFTVEPVDDGSRCRVTIRTRARTAPGFVGLLEKLTTPPISRMIYRKELALLNRAVRQTEHAQSAA